MHFSHIPAVKPLHRFQHLVMAVFPAFGIIRVFVVGAESAVMNAFVGRFNVEVTVKET